MDAARAGAGFLPELSLVAVASEGSVLGHVMVSLVTFEPDADGGARMCSPAPLAVLPLQWGRGIGTALMEEAVAIADGRPEPLVAVLGAPSFYGRFGFVPASEVGIRSPYDAAGPAYQVRALEAPLASGTVVYPPVFGAV